MTKEKAIQHIKRALEVPNRIGLALVDDEALNFVVEELSKDAQQRWKPDEWCTDCKEYDHERHCCPRYNRVIRTTLQEVQSEWMKGDSDEHID